MFAKGAPFKCMDVVEIVAQLFACTIHRAWRALHQQSQIIRDTIDHILCSFISYHYSFLPSHLVSLASLVVPPCTITDSSGVKPLKYPIRCSDSCRLCRATFTCLVDDAAEDSVSGATRPREVQPRTNNPQTRSKIEDPATR